MLRVEYFIIPGTVRVFWPEWVLFDKIKKNVKLLTQANRKINLLLSKCGSRGERTIKFPHFYSAEHLSEHKKLPIHESCVLSRQERSVSSWPWWWSRSWSGWRGPRHRSSHLRPTRGSRTRWARLWKRRQRRTETQHNRLYIRMTWQPGLSLSWRFKH